MFTSVFNVVHHRHGALPSISHAVEPLPFCSMPLSRKPARNSLPSISSTDQHNNIHKLLPTFVNELTLYLHTYLLPKWRELQLRKSLHQPHNITPADVAHKDDDIFSMLLTSASTTYMGFFLTSHVYFYSSFFNKLPHLLPGHVSHFGGFFVWLISFSLQNQHLFVRRGTLSWRHLEG